MESLKNVLKKSYKSIELSLNEIFNEVKESFQNEIEQLKKDNQILKNENDTLKSINNKLENDLNDKSHKIGELEDNQENYQKVSILQNFNKQINDRNLEIKAYESKLRIAQCQIRQMALQIDEMRKEFNSPLKTQEELKEERLLLNNTILNEEQDNLELEKQEQENLEQENQEQENLEQEKQEEEKQEQENQEQENQEEENQEEENQEEEEEDEIEYVKKKISSVYYYVSNEDPKQIYEILDNDDVGECVGYYRSDNKVILKKKK